MPRVALERKDCGQVFFLFQAGGPVPQHAPGLAFLRASGLIDRNLIVFRDDTHSFCLNGFDELIAWCRRFVADRVIAEAYCIGSSRGAVAAILAGHHLGVKKVWAFSPSPRPPADLRTLLACGDGATRYEIFFNTSDQIEPECPILCRELQGLPGVTLIPREGTGHLVAADLGEELAARLPPFRPADG